MSRLTSLLSLLTTLALPSAPVAQEFAPLAGFERVRGATAIASDASGERVAVGTRSSVWLAARGETAQRALRVGAVRDLAFGTDGTLWVASDRGVFSFAGAVATPHAAGLGASGRATRLTWLGDALAVGTEDGLAFRARGKGFVRANGAAPEGAVAALVAASDRELIAVIGGEIAGVRFDAAARVVTDAARENLPAGDGAALDLARASGDVVALRERGLARRTHAGWERVPLALPPGAAPTRIAANARGVFLATETGVLFAPRVDAAFERLSAPAGRAPTSALALGERSLLLAGPRGVLRGELHAQLPASRDEAPATVAAQPAREPGVLAVQRAALRYLALDPERSASLGRRARRSALAPVLELYGGIGGDRSRELDRDETFTSGFDRTFFDRRRERGRDFDAGARLVWQLAGAIYHPEEIDASRESREWLELRDEVLDEISQLYFERRRALLDLARERDPHLAARLALRADELAAGLDAWTGGWWHAQLAQLSPRGPAHELETTP
ncbi:MAG: hypothetical protein FJ091_14070 [Deltaproteobacteria bacterium]|nr:hypothetical protein [Deltaproteobacteria bacterium]